MTNQPQIAVTKDFLHAFENIPRAQQKKTRDFLTKFQQDPTAASINYEPIRDMRDARVRTVRIDHKYRAIVLHPESGNTYVLAWIDNHDEAMAWARSKQFGVNPVTGAFQIIDTELVEEATEAAAATRPAVASSAALFGWLEDADLLRTGLPAPLLPAVRAVDSPAALDALGRYLPEEAYEALTYIALGDSVDQALSAVERIRRERMTAPAVDTADVATALQHPDSQRRVKVITSVEDMFAMLDAPLEDWRVFLHPDQRALVERHFNGPARVLGGAGTGKTVVAMHRARYLARHVFNRPGDRILFTTYTRNLANNIANNLRHLCGDEFDRIEVTNLHAWAGTFLRQHGVPFGIASSEQIDACWSAALAAAETLGFDADFYRTEYDNVVQAYAITEPGGYLRVRRRGQEQPLTRVQRAAVWEVFAAFRAELAALKRIDWGDVITLALQRLAEGDITLRYRAVVVDEVQDMYPAELMLLRQLVPEGPNDIFLVGDAHQRIYSSQPVVMGQCGIAIVGRGHRLRINYRTTAQIRDWAVGVLAGHTVDDMDGGEDSLGEYTSLRSGVEPLVVNFPTPADEAAFICQRLWHLFVDRGAPPEAICVVARSNNQLDALAAALAAEGIPTLKLERNTAEDAAGGVRLATMHRVKGLEFAHVLLAGVNAGVIPHPRVLASDPDALQERCLLHVAASRARDTLTVSSWGRASAFLAAR